MKTKGRKKLLNKTLSALCAGVISLGFATGSVLAVEVSDEDYKMLEALKKKQAEQQQDPHERSHKAEPPTGGHANLAEAATNPIANLAQVQLLNSYHWDNHNSSGGANSTVIQPVYPVKLDWEAVPLLITRTTLEYVWTPDLGDPVHRRDGVGDTASLGLFLPKLETKGVQVGVGWRAGIPTAGDNDFTGSGKWTAGPAALYLNLQTPNLQWGLFVWQNWDVAGKSRRDDVSKTAVQPVITYHFDEGWFVQTPDDPSIYDHEADKWTWNLGAAVGRVTKLGNQPVKMFGGVYHNPEDDAGPTPEWTAKVGLTFLFPI